MKLGLLVVLTVAAVVPGMSDGRRVSECELKKKLGQALILPSSLEKIKERILGICEFDFILKTSVGV